MEENKILQKLEQQDQKFDAISGKLGEHDKKFEQHDQQFVKIDEHFEAVEKHFEAVEKHFEAVDKHLDRHDKQFEVIIDKLVDHDEQLKDLRENMLTKADGQEMKDTLELIATTVQRLDQERLSTISRIDRIEDEVGIHGTEINNIKVHLNMP